MLKLVTSEKEITYCQRLFEDELRRSLGPAKRRTIGHPGGSFVNEIHFGEGLWYSKQELEGPNVEVPRHWNGFGIEERKTGHQIIVVEVNPPLKGKDRRVSGAFGKDEARNKYYLLHRGGIGGARKGIGKEAFRSWYRGAWTTLYDEHGHADEAILIGALGVGTLIDPLRTFVHEVANFKREASEGKLTREQRLGRKMLDFIPEWHGKRKGRRRSILYYESYHGAVVNALADKFKSQRITGSVFNTQLIDLGVEQSGELVEIYEVKSSVDRQSVYSGVGQLIVHSEGDASVRKFLVVPLDQLFPKLVTKLKKLGIETIGYQIQKGKITFTT
jgi:hypothetical protein